MAAQGNWSPAALAVGIAGAALTVYGLTRRAPLACIVGTVGLALLGTGLLDLEAGGPAGRSGGEGVAPRGGQMLHVDFLASRT